MKHKLFIIADALVVTGASAAGAISPGNRRVLLSNAQM